MTAMRLKNRVHGQDRGMLHITEVDRFQAWCDYLVKLCRFQCDLCGTRFFYAQDEYDHRVEKTCRVFNRSRSKHA